MRPPNDTYRCFCGLWTTFKVRWHSHFRIYPLILSSGEEADIIVLNLVRNITEGGGRGGIGFLKVHNVFTVLDV